MASKADSAFQPEAEAALAGFHAVRKDLERRVRRGEMTVKVARDKATEAASRLRELLVPRAEGFSPVSRAFLERLVEASNARKAARDRGSLESLQRETNRLLKQSLVEQQLASRAAEFEGKSFVRTMTGGAAAPTLDSLLRFHASAAQSGDDAAMEWARRQLEAMRPRVFGPDEVRKIDVACDRPDRLNERVIGRYVEALKDAAPDTLETFVAEALAGRDANACAAAFLLARDMPDASSARWVRSVLSGLNEFPDAALNALREWEAEARAADSEAALAKADYVATLAEADARFTGLEAPTIGEVDRLERLERLPVASPDQPIGLALDRRGHMADDPIDVESPAMS
jgi:hypothetical protein